jgi:hypothetical protein
VLRRHCERRLRQLDLPPPSPLGLHVWCDEIGQRRGRPLHLLPLDFTGVAGACGLWLATDQADYFAVDATAPPILRRHIVLHELAHMWCGHEGSARIDPDALGFQILDADMVRGVLARSLAREEQEREAEVFADVTALWLARHIPTPRSRFRRWRTPTAGPMGQRAAAGSARPAEYRGAGR